MKATVCLCAIVVSLLFISGGTVRGENAFSLGYGFAAWNQGKSTGNIEGGKRYNFEQAKYLYERPILWTGLALMVEPFASYVSNPNAGTDFGVGVGFKYYPFQTHKDGFYLMGGSGMAYSTIGFQEQGTHLFFIGQGGIGYRSGRFFIENRFRHFSNGGTARPNWSVNTNIIAVGMYF